MDICHHQVFLYQPWLVKGGMSSANTVCVNLNIAITQHYHHHSKLVPQYGRTLQTAHAQWLHKPHFRNQGPSWPILIALSAMGSKHNPNGICCDTKQNRIVYFISKAMCQFLFSFHFRKFYLCEDLCSKPAILAIILKVQTNLISVLWQHLLWWLLMSYWKCDNVTWN